MQHPNPNTVVPFSVRLEQTAIKLGQIMSFYSYPTSWEKLEIDDNNSVWASYTPDYVPNAPLSQNTSADLVVIGGGFTGVSTAYHVSQQQPDKRVILVEAKSLGNGASGRNGGMMLNWINGIRDTSDEMTKLTYDFTHSGIEMIVDIIQRHNLDVSYRRDGCMEVFTSQERADKAQAEAEHLNKIGVPVHFLSPKELQEKVGLTNVYGAMADRSEGQLNGAQYLRALRPVLEAQGVEVYEQTPVLSIEEGDTITLTTPQGAIKAKAIVLATNGYTGKLGYFRKSLFPLHSHVFATPPLTEAQRHAIGWNEYAGYSDDLDRISYSTMTKEGHIVFGGGSNQSYAYLFNNRTAYPGTPHSTMSAFDEMQVTQQNYLPQAKGLPVSHRWTGTLGISLQRNTSIGVMNKNIYYGVAYNGHGVTLGNLAGRVIADIYSGNDAQWRQHEWYEGNFSPIPLEPLRYIGYHLFTRLTGRSPRA